MPDGKKSRLFYSGLTADEQERLEAIEVNIASLLRLDGNAGPGTWLGEHNGEYRKITLLLNDRPNHPLCTLTPEDVLDQPATLLYSQIARSLHPG